MGNVSKNFNRSEFTCQCGCGFDVVDIDNLKIVQMVRDHFGKPVVINSGCRCKKHNQNVNGSKDSWHMKAGATDIAVLDTTPEDVAFYVNSKYPDSLGIIIHDTFVHIDRRPNKYREDKRS
jgi:uncharacterized protein YcbK (DUF882 family)